MRKGTRDFAKYVLCKFFVSHNSHPICCCRFGMWLCEQLHFKGGSQESVGYSHGLLAGKRREADRERTISVMEVG